MATETSVGMTDPECTGRPQHAPAAAPEPGCNGSAGGLLPTAPMMCDAAAAAARGKTDARHTASSPPFGRSSSALEFHLIREVDADILEQGVEEKRGADLADFDDEGRRLEASESNASLTELEDDGAEADAESALAVLDVSGISHRSEGGAVDDESSSDLSPSTLFSLAQPQHVSSAGASSGDLPAIAEDSSCIGVVAEESHEALAGSNGYFMSSTSPISPIKPQVQELEIDEDAIAMRRAHGRSSSFDRRVNESAQFAEAVGEDADSLLLKKIIEEDSSSDYDDDEIDEIGGENLIPLAEEEPLVDYIEGELHENDEQQAEGTSPEQLAGAPSQEKIEPRCVSTDLGKVSLPGGESSDRPTTQEPGELPQFSTTLDAEIANSAPTSPAPSPLKEPSTSRTFPTSFHPPCYVNWKFARQNSNSFNIEGGSSRHSGGPLAPSSSEVEFDYRGIQAHRLEITKRGMSRGNYAQLHRKAWLEVSDKHHRYGKNLRLYYKHWESLGHPFHMFFDWLDSKGEAVGNPLPDLPEIPRPVLDADTVLYITDPEISGSYALDVTADPADGSAIIIDQSGSPIDTGKEGWMFVLRDHVLYGSQKVTSAGSPAAGESTGSSPEAEAAIDPKQRFHHSSFFGGKAVASAGIFITDEKGRLTHLYPHSGHYRPGEAHVQRALYFFQRLGVELSTFDVDMQQLLKVCRKLVLAPKGGDAPATEGGDKAKDSNQKDKENNATNDNGKEPQNNSQGEHAPEHHKMKKSKKTDTLHLMCGHEVACFLAHKAVMIEQGVFHQIHRIRRIPKESRTVRHILSVVNN